MISRKVDLFSFSNSSFKRGANSIKEVLWLFVRSFFFLNNPLGLYSVKRFLLRLFGAKIGKGVVIKPGAKITFPWKLEIGDFSWIGEESWIINFDHVRIGKSACISQRAVLCTGNHDYAKSTFDLITKPIIIEDGVWIAANAWVGPGITVKSHAVLSAGSIATHNLETYKIYQGNPAKVIRDRIINS